MKRRTIVRDYTVIALGCFIYAAALCFFVYPRSFTFGGTSGLSVLMAKVLPLSASNLTVILNIVLMITALLMLGRQFALRTLIGSVLMTCALAAVDLLPFVKQFHTPWMWADLVLAVLLIGLASALLFSVNASSGGTDILAVILTSKKPSLPIGRALLVSDILIVAGSFFLFGLGVGICSVLGLILKALFVDAFMALGRRISKHRQ